MNRAWILGCFFLLGCAEDEETSTTSVPVPGTSVVFDLDADLAANFYDMPYPSDLRLNAAGGPDLTGFPAPEGVAQTMMAPAQDRPGFPMIPAAYFRFDGAVPVALGKSSK